MFLDQTRPTSYTRFSSSVRILSLAACSTYGFRPRRRAPSTWPQAASRYHLRVRASGRQKNNLRMGTPKPASGFSALSVSCHSLEKNMYAQRALGRPECRVLWRAWRSESRLCGNKLKFGHLIGPVASDLRTAPLPAGTVELITNGRKSAVTKSFRSHWRSETSRCAPRSFPCRVTAGLTRLQPARWTPTAR